MATDQILQVLPAAATLRPDPPGNPASALGNVAIETHGCKLNQADSAVLAQEFARAGYRLVDSRRDADIIVVNTCTVTSTADSKARQALRAAHRANPDAVVVAAGCYPERAEEDLRRLPEVSLVVGNRSKPDWWRWPYPRAPLAAASSHMLKNPAPTRFPAASCAAAGP